MEIAYYKIRDGLTTNLTLKNIRTGIRCMIYIIADDLTGANDTGVQFAKKGYKTLVSVSDKIGFLPTPEDVEVWVIDTETRELADKTAREKLKGILSTIKVHKKDIVYKKVDSTLRGNIGAELEEIMKILPRDLCMFSPSYPFYHRITVGGYLVVGQQPLGLSEYAGNNLRPVPVEDYFIPFLLKKQTALPVAQLDLKEVAKGGKAILLKLNELYQRGDKIIVIDSTAEEHLKDIWLSGLEFEGTVLFSGSAGLANHFPYVGNKYKEEGLKINLENNQSPVIVVAGSRNLLMEEQVNYLKNRLSFTELKIDLESIFTNREALLASYVTQGIKALQDKQDLIIHTNALYHEKHSINKKLMLKYQLSFRELELKLKTFLGELVSKLVENSGARNLILTGGDVAVGVCAALGLHNLYILDELLPGIPLSLAKGKNFKLNMITKAGGFGKEDTLYNLINKLRNY